MKLYISNLLEDQKMLKNYICPGCGGTIEFSPETDELYCFYCGSRYSVTEWKALYGDSPEEQPAADPIAQAAPSAADTVQEAHREAYIQMQILHCNSCGGELAIDGVESSSFCPYCGQATVVMDRLEYQLRPDYILPFRITKEQAEAAIRSRFRMGSYIPKEIKEFHLDKLRGIYIPFWLYDMYYGDDQYWKYEKKENKSTYTRYSHRLADCFFKKMTLDASERLNDNSSQRLEPYFMNDLKTFDPAYLSGFYSDRYDVGTDETDSIAFMRAKELFNANMQKTIPGKKQSLVDSMPVHHITKRQYAYLPVWFLTFRQDNTPYTILMNGQTGKIVGAVPFIKKKVYIRFILLAILFCVLFAIIGAISMPYIMNMRSSSDTGKIGGLYFAGIFAALCRTWPVATRKYKALMLSIKLTQSKTTSRFVRERTERS